MLTVSTYRNKWQSARSPGWCNFDSLAARTRLLLDDAAKQELQWTDVHSSAP
jgi:hypothetical protein